MVFKVPFTVYANGVLSLFQQKIFMTFFVRGGFNWPLLGSLSLVRFSLFVLEAEKYPKINPK